MKEYRTITVPYSVVGTHYYKDAPDQVAFIRHPHRHIFNMKATLEVTHADRELEFFIVKSAICDCMTRFPRITGHMIDFGGLSCESIGTDLGRYLQNRFKKANGDIRDVTVSVQEDNECSAEVYLPGSEGIGNSWRDDVVVPRSK